MNYSSINQHQAEDVLYDHPDYPVYVRKGRLTSYPCYSAEEHWHDDLEFILILSGNMQYNVNGKIVLLREGEGIFINARQLHFGYSEKHEECIFICILLHPMLLCASQSIEQKYVTPLLSDASLPFVHLSEQAGWKRRILDNIRRIYEQKNSPTAELNIQKSFFEIWIELYENTARQERAEVPRSQKLSVLKRIISYMNCHYKERLTLDSIAASGSISKSGCCELFKMYINKSPIEYLTRLRLRKGLDLLVQTDMTVLEISLEVGFSGASYFTEIFHRLYGCTPNEYRKAHKSNNDQKRLTR